MNTAINAIEMLGITKIFPGVVANDNVSLIVKENEIHALLGENGAGKSTLMSILFGAYAADSGTIKIKGKEVRIKNPNDATALGIGMVHQHFKLVANYTVTENIILGMEPTTRYGTLDIKKAEAEVEALSKQYGLQVDPRALISDISVGMQQRVEILKTLYRHADIMILDEPSAVLTPQEIDELMEIIRKLKQEGKTVILITHKLQEIKAVADRCTILRRGKYINTIEVAETSEEQMAEMMVGRVVKFHIDKNPLNKRQLIFETRNLSVHGFDNHHHIEDVSISVHAGEIVGLAGIDGNGQRELIYAITGLLPVDSGNIFLRGEDITKLSIIARVHRGLGFIPEDRQKHGLVLNFTVAENMIIKNYDENEYSSRLSTLNFKKIKDNAEHLIDEYDIRTGTERGTALCKSLSGGNQQKVIIAREISLSPDFLLIAKPTRGLDVGAIEYIRKRILAERDAGKAILLISFELDEIMNLCDRIAIISHGKIAGIFDEGTLTEKQIGVMMAGAQSET
ncbi:ABC transporter, ATP-binding protein [Treponema phagedenis F0421]|uniref:ABC transporter ATP-binding protein n=1 Tax=Treponema phagedenis TaxID=162 RepID=UPI0001F63E19|nr:ABC transporter ATP-binding protein [Treponema phagedenis]EFW38171.1 ABC transporter, ATP-binding protein [Treponema phagedenis F0421]